MIYPLSRWRDRLAFRFSRAGWSVGRAGAGEKWLLPGVHVVKRHCYFKVAVHLWKRTYTYERRS